MEVSEAIKNVIYSAFGNSGQKCSATSLLILEKEIYDDENFKRQLVDAAKSFKVGSAWEFSNKMGALIRPPSGDLQRTITTLEAGESWALEPQRVHDNPHMWTPGIKYGVQPGSYTHMTEFFGPVLGVMRAEDLDEAIDKEDALLRMALAWRRKLIWGKLDPYADDIEKTIRAIKSYRYQWEQEFGVEKDYFHLRSRRLDFGALRPFPG